MEVEFINKRYALAKDQGDKALQPVAISLVQPPNGTSPSAIICLEEDLTLEIEFQALVDLTKYESLHPWPILIRGMKKSAYRVILNQFYTAILWLAAPVNIPFQDELNELKKTANSLPLTNPPTITNTPHIYKPLQEFLKKAFNPQQETEKNTIFRINTCPHCNQPTGFLRMADACYNCKLTFTIDFISFAVRENRF